MPTSNNHTTIGGAAWGLLVMVWGWVSSLDLQNVVSIIGAVGVIVAIVMQVRRDRREAERRREEVELHRYEVEQLKLEKGKSKSGDWDG